MSGVALLFCKRLRIGSNGLTKLDYANHRNISISPRYAYASRNRFFNFPFFCYAKRKPIYNSICVSIIGLTVSFGCYTMVHRKDNIKARSALQSNFSEEEWAEIAEEINEMGLDLKQSVHILWYEYVAMLASVLCFGAGIVLWPCWTYYFRRKIIRTFKIGRLRCEFTGTFWGYFWSVIVYRLLYGICTLGLHTLFGFAYINEEQWFHSHTVWYVAHDDADNDDDDDERY